MIHGMTGFGRGEAVHDDLRVVVDVRTVNHRFLDVDLRGTQLPPSLEQRVRRAAAQRLMRGRAQVAVALDAGDGRAEPVAVNRAMLRGIVASLRELAREMGVRGDLTLDHLVQLPWARAVELAPPELGPEQEEAVLLALSRALDATLDVRRREGEDLANDLGSRLQSLRRHLDSVRQEADGLSRAQAERLRERMAELLAGAAVSEERIVQEAALLADRADVAEELTRLGAYLEQVAELIAARGACGKRLDFTLQEALREANTLGSKSRGFAIASTVIEIKSELERMREQAANVE